MMRGPLRNTTMLRRAEFARDAQVQGALFVGSGAEGVIIVL